MYIHALRIVSWCSFSPLFDGLWIMRVVRSHHVLRRHTAPALCRCSTAHGDTTSASSALALCSCSTSNTTLSRLFVCFPLPHGYHNQLSRAANAAGGRRLARVTQFDRPVAPTKRQLVVWLRLALLSTRRAARRRKTPLLFLSNRRASLLRHSRPRQRAQRVKFSRVGIHTATQPGGWMDKAEWVALVVFV